MITLKLPVLKHEQLCAKSESIQYFILFRLEKSSEIQRKVSYMVPVKHKLMYWPRVDAVVVNISYYRKETCQNKGPAEDGTSCLKLKHGSIKL